MDVSPAAALPQARDVFSSLPTEIFLEIREWSEVLHDKEEHTAILGALSCVSRRFNSEFDSKLYEFNIRNDDGNVIVRTAYSGNLSTLKKAVAYGASVNFIGRHSTTCRKLLDKISPDGPNPYASSSDLNKDEVLSAMKSTPIHFAIAGGHDHCLEYFLDQGARVSDLASVAMCGCWLNSRRGGEELFQWLPLHLAICNGHIITVELLARRDAGILLRRHQLRGNIKADTPNAFHCAAQTGNVLMINTLLRHFGYEDIDQKTVGDETVLHIAAGSWDVDNASWITRHTAESVSTTIKALVRLGIPLEDQNDDGWTAFKSALEGKYWKVAMTLLEAGADSKAGCLDDLILTSTKPQDEEQRVLLIHRMINLGTELEDAYRSPICWLLGGYSCTPLADAVMCGDWTLANILLDYGADTQSSNGPENMVFLAMDTGYEPSPSQTPQPSLNVWQEGRETVLRKLVAMGRALDTGKYRGGKGMSKHHTCMTFYATPTHRACEDPVLLSLLLDLGADPNNPMRGGKTAMHIFFKHYQDAAPDCSVWYDSGRVLLQNGASLKLMDGKKKTPLDYLIPLADHPTVEARDMALPLLSFVLEHVKPDCISNRQRKMTVAASVRAARSLRKEV